jgi:hypothetical protein
MLDLLFVALYQTVAGAPAEQPPQTEPQENVQASGEQAGLNRIRDRNTRRCRVEAVTGSRLGARVCLSQAEHEELSQEARDLLTDHMRIADDR